MRRNNDVEKNCQAGRRCYRRCFRGFDADGRFCQCRNPFGLSELNGGYAQIADSHMEGKCGGDKGAEGKCGGDKGAEGKCGGDKKAGEGKCGAGKCGGDKKAAEGKCSAGKCGGDKKAAEGKCGSNK